MKAKKLKRILVLSLLLVVMTIVIVVMLNNNSVTAYASDLETSSLFVDDLTEKEENSVVVSYKEVFKHYYDMMLAEAKIAGKKEVCSFDEFCERYYMSGMDLPTYTDIIIRHKIWEQSLESIFANIRKDGDDTISQPMRSPTDDADYILLWTKEDIKPTSGTFVEPSVTPANKFARRPVYSSYDYSAVQVGDIIYEPNGWTHVGIVMNTSKSSEYGNYIQTQDTIMSGVLYGFLDDTRMVDFEVKILRVVGSTQSKRNAAVNFCRAQFGKPYIDVALIPFRLQTSINSANWYCSEMIYAAYLSQNINISAMKDQFGNDDVKLVSCLPYDIFVSFYTTDLAKAVEHNGRYGLGWRIRIKNIFSDTRFVEYNSKMCFEDDARYWTNLYDILSFNLAPGAWEDVWISDNWFATHIVVGFSNDTERYIFYADNIAGGNTATEGYSYMHINTNIMYYFNTYFTISNAGKTSDGKWKINIYNPGSIGTTVYYNTKMCNSGDAQNWTGLSDIASRYIGGMSTIQVQIAGNGWATHITVSGFRRNGQRAITYANQLYTNPNRLTSGTNLK